MATTLLEQPISYITSTSDATPVHVVHSIPGPFNNQDCWGHWTIRCTARKVGLTPCAHFYQRVSGIWTSGGGLVFTGTQPAMEAEKDASMTACTMAVLAAFDEIDIVLTGIAATDLNWFLTVVSHNVYAEN